MVDLRLYLAQRISALVMVPLVFGHLILMIYAVQNGFSADEILARTKGSLGWGLYYGLFVFAVTIHGAIGLRAILFEWCGLNKTLLNSISWAVGLVMLALGIRAVIAVVL